MLFRNY